MDNKGKPKSLTISDKINTFAQVDVRIGMSVEQAPWLRLPVLTLNPIMKNCEETKRKCRPFSMQWKLLKCSPLEERESALAA
jgi:hypothetical protein